MIKSRMSGDVHVWFCEQLRVKIPGLTRLSNSQAGVRASALLYSLVITAKENKKDPLEAITIALKQIRSAQTVDDFEAIARLFLR